MNWPFINFRDYGFFLPYFKFFSFDSDSSGDVCSRQGYKIEENKATLPVFG